MSINCNVKDFLNKGFYRMNHLRHLLMGNWWWSYFILLCCGVYIHMHTVDNSALFIVVSVCSAHLISHAPLTKCAHTHTCVLLDHLSSSVNITWNISYRVLLDVISIRHLSIHHVIGKWRITLRKQIFVQRKNPLEGDLCWCALISQLRSSDIVNRVRWYIHCTSGMNTLNTRIILHTASPHTSHYH